ncbi:hypothetical protein Q1695_015863 [Nippostrongylus brasiliensis]|nr:hypothetical protein Q1695_015863 [Nippostrongylus brasiliensis]
MGHRGFVKSRVLAKSEESTENSYCRFPNPAARNYFDEMAPVNGVRELSEQQLREAQALRDNFRDEVSKRMGELLLRGVTMLDAYCQVCNGILMEDRNGVRTCVTCDLYAERTREGSRLVAEVPLDTTSDGVTPGNSLLSSEEQPSPLNVVRTEDVGQCPSRSRKVIRAESRESTPSVRSTTTSVPAAPTKSVSIFTGCDAALMAIDRKLKWASEKINHSENPSEIRELFALVNEGLNIIKSAKVDGV